MNEKDRKSTAPEKEMRFFLILIFGQRRLAPSTMSKPLVPPAKCTPQQSYEETHCEHPHISSQ
jgi:hypothetical protein